MRARAGVRPRPGRPPRAVLTALVLGMVALTGLPGADRIGGVAAVHARAPDEGTTLEHRATVRVDRERVSADGRLRLRARVQPAAAGAKLANAPASGTLQVAYKIASLECPIGDPIFRDGFEM
jgi:hypothetical protein